MIARCLIAIASLSLCIFTLLAQAEPAPTPTPLAEPGMDTKSALPKKKNLPKTTKDPVKTQAPGTDAPAAPGGTEHK